jgi:hypothetical protein
VGSEKRKYQGVLCKKLIKDWENAWGMGKESID